GTVVANGPYPPLKAVSVCGPPAESLKKSNAPLPLNEHVYTPPIATRASIASDGRAHASTTTPWSSAAPADPSHRWVEVLQNSDEVQPALSQRIADIERSCSFTPAASSRLKSS